MTKSRAKNFLGVKNIIMKHNYPVKVYVRHPMYNRRGDTNMNLYTVLLTEQSNIYREDKCPKYHRSEWTENPEITYTFVGY